MSRLKVTLLLSFAWFGLIGGYVAIVAIAAAQTVVPAPVAPDATSVLAFFGLGQYAASIIALVGLAAFVIAHLIAWGLIPKPAPGATGVWPSIFALLNWLAANYGKSASAIAVILLPLALIACAALPAVGPVLPPIQVAQTEIALTAAEKLALNYVTLPQCKTGGSPICSQAAAVAAVKDYDNKAYAAMKLARASGSTGDVQAAFDAIAALAKAVPSTATTNN